MTYPYVQAKHDYGVRQGPVLGLMYHMAEGGGTVHYLSTSGGVLRGVSVHAVCDVRGVVTQMLPWSHNSGSLNPADRSTDKLYYGHKHLVNVLGPKWTDPNTAVLSMEIEGFAAIGPSPAQVDAAVAWGEDMKAQFSTLRGALGHADQTNTKRCPGTSINMRLVFEGVGGHGLWHPQSSPEEPVPLPTINDETRRLVDLKVGDELLDLSGKPLVDVSVDQTQESPWSMKVAGGTYYLVSITTGGVNTPALLHATAAANARPVPVPVPNCDNAVAAEHERTLAQAKAALEAIV